MNRAAINRDQKSVLHLQEIPTNHREKVGQSILILSGFSKEKLPVSPGFVITTDVFNDLVSHMTQTSNTEFKNVEKNIIDYQFSKEIETNIKKCYAKISGFIESYVNLRALVIDHDGYEINHRSFVVYDIHGEKQIIHAIKTLYKEIIFDNKELSTKFFNKELNIVILVQKAQQAESSGILFTTDLITKASNRMVIEAVYGLEILIDNDPIIPDQYIYDKSNDKIIEKYISKQEYMVVRRGISSHYGNQKVPITLAWQQRQKLDDKHIFALAKIGIAIEEGLKTSQQISWSYEGGKIWINFIENSVKLEFKNKKIRLQDLINEELVELPTEGIDMNIHIPKEVVNSKAVTLDILLSDKNTGIQNDSRSRFINLKEERI